MRISNSFSEGEIAVIDFILTTLLRGGTPSMAVRSKDFASLCRKVQAMKSRVGEIKDGKVSEPKGGKRTAPDRSSVGLIDAPSGESEADAELDSDAESLEETG